MLSAFVASFGCERKEPIVKVEPLEHPDHYADKDQHDGSADAAGLARGEVVVASYFIVTRPDLRKCAAPACGGHFVAFVNSRVTRCANRTWADECHVFELDLSQLELDAELETKARAALVDGRALVRGELEQVDTGAPWPADVLVASELWIGSTGNQPKGHFSRVDDTGVQCVTFPCGTIWERSLNTRLADPLTGVDLAATGASADEVEAAREELGASGLLVVGEHGVVEGPAGVMSRLDVSEFYRRVR